MKLDCNNKIMADSNCTYAVVDMSMKKKKKNRSLPKKEEESDTSTAAHYNMPLYSVVEKCNFGPEKEDDSHTETPMEDVFSSKAEDKPSTIVPEAVVSTTFTAREKSTILNGKQSTRVACFVSAAVACIVFALICFACFGILFMEISKLKSGMTTVMQPLSANQSTSNIIVEIITEQQAFFNSLLNSSISDIADIKIQLNKTQQLQLNTSLHSLETQLENERLIGLLNTSLLSLETQLENERLIGLLNTSLLSLETRLEDIGQYPFFPASSCATLPSSFPSGYYWVRASNGSAVRVYCDMTRSCSGVTGGWMRVAELDMTNSSHQCPSGLRQRTDSNIRTCVRNTDSSGCSAVQYSTASIHYSRVCGKVIAYQNGTTNAFRQRSSNSISSAYVDGVSLTHGDPKKHIWTLAAALASESDGDTPASNCRCNFTTSPLPSFVGMDYFCDTGLKRFIGGSSPGFLGTDPLWDGGGCEEPNNCCSFNDPPWFYKQLPQPTTEDIEMRVCRDEVSSNEDIAIEMVEIYVQ